MVGQRWSGDDVDRKWIVTFNDPDSRNPMAEGLSVAGRLAERPPKALQETKRSLNLHLHRATLDVLPFALFAETESLSSPDVAAKARQFVARTRM